MEPMIFKKTQMDPEAKDDNDINKGCDAWVFCGCCYKNLQKFWSHANITKVKKCTVFVLLLTLDASLF